MALSSEVRKSVELKISEARAVLAKPNSTKSEKAVARFILSQWWSK